VHLTCNDGTCLGSSQLRGKKHFEGERRVIPGVRRSGLDTAMSAALAPWRKPRAVHDPGKVLLDVALAVAVGGDCLADVALARAEPAVFGPVASDPTVSRLVDTLAAQCARGRPESPARMNPRRLEITTRLHSGQASTCSTVAQTRSVRVASPQVRTRIAANCKSVANANPLPATPGNSSRGQRRAVRAALAQTNAHPFDI